MNRNSLFACAVIVAGLVFVAGCEKHPLPGNPPVQAEKPEAKGH
ncbi:MAG: hypothetical protein RLZZ253_3006 [Verrucomicrobiota bacterium]